MNQDIRTVRLLYTEPSTGMVHIVHPSGESSIDFIAKHAIPKNAPYWIILGTELPEDRSFRDAWELDLSILGEPNGVGGAE